ncbi:MAG TPA: S8 family serine peptidase, partial [Phenylobacterium sp.]
MPGMTINGITLDPQQHGPALAAFGFGAPDVSNTDYVLVQFKEPPTASQRAELAAAGAEIIGDMIPVNTFEARFPGTDLTPIQQLPFVALATRYMKGFKVHPSLVAGDVRDPVAVLSMEGGSNRLRSHQERVTVVLHEGAATRETLKDVAAAAGVEPDALQLYGHRIPLSVSSDRLASLADIDGVRHVEPQPRNTLFNDVAGRIVRADTLHAGAGGATGLDGAGQVVAVCDTGFDRGATNDVHPAFDGRVLALYSLGRTKANDPDGHGTHVCGTVLGDEQVAGYGTIRGGAPGARLVVQSVLDDGGGLDGLPLDLKTLFAAPYVDHGARVHSNSWGDSRATSHRQYDSQARDVDAFVHRNRDMVVCFAAGNDGIDGNQNGVVDDGSVTPPGTAKNCITVGASESQRQGSRSYGSIRPTWYPKGPLKDDLSADNPEGLAAFSSRGTTVDGRIKPDVVAPGTSILSCLSRDATLSTIFGANPPPGYMFDTGTSMATPLVAGCAALVRQQLARDRGVANPSAALVKAVLINGARPLKGQYVPSEAGFPPNSDQGFGLIDMQASVDPGLTVHDEGQLLADTGDQAAFEAHVGPQGRLKVTLVWTDAPGLGLQNDLD